MVKLERKSWVIGVKINQKSRVFDWNELLRKRILHSNIDDTKFFVVLCKDNKSFFAYKNNSADMPTIVDDTIFLQSKRYKMNGVGINTLIPSTPCDLSREVPQLENISTQYTQMILYNGLLSLH
ncbi:MAG: DUF3179 domain-containing protein [Ignavibacteria bacterium]|nr:DUF3179 domain-containing protein [Ignavibacteria bacterium]